MSKVYLSKDIDKILDRIDFSKLGEKVAIKVHFGEKGCNTYVNPLLVKKVYEKITGFGKTATLVECNVLYKGSRTNSTDHINTAREHGFGDMPIDILDGDLGKEQIDINGCRIGAGLKNYDSLLVISHFKGHMEAGFGGAIKNVGMGLGSRQGKLYMHTALKPFSLAEKCTGCGLCISSCAAEAIAFDDNNKARVDDEKCIGCAMCIAVCPFGAMQVPWDGRTAEDMQEKVAEYTAAVLSLFPNPVFINVLEKITVHCDCMGLEQQPVMPDIGITISEDIVSIDKASLDLANKFSDGKFNDINLIDKDKSIKFAEDLNLGSLEYKLIEL